MQQVIQGERELTHVQTEVRPHPRRSGWAVLAVVKTPLGSHLYCSTSVFVLKESARWHMVDVIDDRLNAVLHREALQDDPDIFEAMRGVSELEQLPTVWAPGQFDSLE
jgi:hypothetical protein